MKKTITILTTTLLLVGQVSFAQDADYSQQLINQVESIKQSSLSASAKQEKLHRTCITSYLLEAKKNWEKLTPMAKKYFNVLMARPVLTNEQIHYSTYFDIHYTTTGADAVNPADTQGGGNGVPDYVDNMAAVFDYVYLTDSVSHNYTMPPADGAGGSDYYDVYIYDIGIGLYGFVSSETNIGDNPNSTITETSAHTSWMGMNNDYSWVGSGSAGAIDTAVKVTAAHEFFHSIQMGYTTDNTNFISEATAAWMEDVIYPNLDDNLQYLMDIFGTPDVALNLNSSDNPPANLAQHWYAGWIYFKYLQEKTNTNIVRKIYERSITVDEIQAIDDELIANWSLDFTTSFENWLIANAIMDNNSAFNPYTYSRAQVYDNYITNNGGLNIEDVIIFTGTSISWDSDIDGNEQLHRLSADYLVIVPNQNFSLTLSLNNPSADLDIVLLKVNSTSGTLVVQPSVVSGNDFVITVTDQSNFDGFLAIVERFDEIVTDTLSEQYTLTITGVTGVPNLHNSMDKISIYPNPVKDKLIISGLSDKENFSFEIKDVLGKTVYPSANIVGREKFIADISDIDNGVYFLTLTDSNNKSKIQKVVISK